MKESQLENEEIARLQTETEELVSELQKRKDWSAD